MLLTVDFLEFAVKNCSLEKMLKFLNLEDVNFKHTGTFNVNYKKSLSLYGYMKIGYENHTTVYNIYVSLSGSGCRLLEDYNAPSFDWFQFISALVNDFEVSFRRIDIAIDDYTEVLNTERMAKYYEAGKFAGACRTVPLQHRLRAQEMIFGSTQSGYLIRVYNKGIERGYKAGENIVIENIGEVVQHWWRIEQQIRSHKSEQFISQWLAAGSEALADISCGHILEFVRFLTKPNDKKNSQRIPVASWWLNFLDNAKRIKFTSKPGTVYNRHKLENFLNTQAASSLRTYIHLLCLSPEELYHHFDNDEIRLNGSQLALLRANAYRMQARLDRIEELKEFEANPDPGFDIRDFQRDFIKKLLQEDNQYIQYEMSDFFE